MRQRVAIAAALGRDPQLLLADEPTTALDTPLQAEVLDLLGTLRRRRGMSLILVTHDLDVAFSACDRVLLLYAGSVVESGPVAALETRPRHPYTLGLLTSRVPRERYVDTLTSIPGVVPSAESVRRTCAFAARCSWTAEQCVGSRPRLRKVGPRHESACVRIQDIAAEVDALLDARGASRGGGEAARPPTGDLVEVAGLGKTFRTKPLVGAARSTRALDGVSLRIRAGESVGLLGESGSGKTTLARILLGLETADSGEIRFATLPGPRRPAVQIVFQDPYSSLNPSLTIGSTLREAARRRSARSPGSGRPTVPELLAMVGLPAGHADRRPSALSGGERQRVAIARAIATDPDLLICDEPVAALDVSVQAQILQLLRELHLTTAMAMLFITHDLAVARQMTERVIVLHRGRIVEAGETATVLDLPTHWYTRKLVAAR